MDEIKNKFLDLIHKQGNHPKIPAMGFSDFFVQNVTISPVIVKKPSVIAAGSPEKEEIDESHQKLSDQEVLESIDPIYFEENCDITEYELKNICETDLTLENIQNCLDKLKTQQKVISKKVLQHILEERNACNEEFESIGEAEKQLQEALWMCNKARSYLNYAKTHLTTNNLHVLAGYQKREKLKDLLKTLNSIRAMKSTDIEVQKLLAAGNYSGAIALLLQCKDSASQYTEYKCVESLNQKLQETLMMTEVQLDTILNEMTHKFDVKKYGQLQEAYKLLNKSLTAMDQFHINFISAIHSTVNQTLRSYVDESNSTEEKQKFLFEQLCESVSVDKYIPCLISICKEFWTILASYYQTILWHQNYKLFQNEASTKAKEKESRQESERIKEEKSNNEETHDLYIQEKLKKGQFRIWTDMQSKLCVYLSSPKLKMLKYEQFIQVISITQRLKKIGVEFCGEPSEKLMEKMQMQSEAFFKRYHLSCLEEICLFLDNESWAPVDCFTNILQLQEFRTIKHSLHKQKPPSIEVKVTSLSSEAVTEKNNCDEIVSIHSQEGSSIYGSCGYFLRFSEKSSPFDGGLDATMLEEDILSGIVDEASCYFSEESDDDGNKAQQTCNKTENELENSTTPVLANNTSLNVLRCIGRYLEMCKLLHNISPQIITSMLELIDFYMYAILDIFGKDSTVSVQSLLGDRIQAHFDNISETVIPKVKGWPLNFSSLINNELSNPETLFGLSHRIVAAESGSCMIKQFEQLRPYLEHVLPASFNISKILNFIEMKEFSNAICKPIYISSASKVLDLQGILNAMGKIKWDVNHVSVQHSGYINTINRSVQTFAMRLEEISATITVPTVIIWRCLAHVTTHLLVEGFSNVKKCSAGGRALMQLDFTHFMSILELISGLKFDDYRQYVDAYVKAYYFPIELFENWIQEQRYRNDYSIKQLSNLVMCVCSNDKRNRQKLLGLLEASNVDNN